MGLGSIVIPARAVNSRGGKVVLFAPNEMVESVLKTAGIDTLLPVHHDLAAAIAALGVRSAMLPAATMPGERQQSKARAAPDLAKSAR